MPTFDPKASSTFAYTQRTLTIRYGSGNVAGVLGTDVVTFPSSSAAESSNFIVPNQTFGVVDHVSSSLLRPPVSGLLGLGFQSIASSQATPPWEALVKQGAWKDPLMGFYFTRYNNATSLDEQLAQVGLGSLFAGTIIAEFIIIRPATHRLTPGVNSRWVVQTVRSIAAKLTTSTFHKGLSLIGSSRCHPSP